MAETVKSLLVKFGTDTQDMEAGFKKADGLIAANAEKFKKAGRAMAVAGAAITGAFALMIKSYVTAGDEIHKMALRTSFSVEALSALKFAAEISGATLSDVEKGIKKMSKTILDASDGLTTYVRAFDRIGLSAEELIKLSPEEQFDKIAKAIAGVENPTIRAATAQDIFGRAGTKLLPLFAAGEKGLEALKKRAYELGIVFDQDAADGAAALNDAMTTLKGAFTGAARSIVEALIPVVTDLSEKITNIVIKVKDWVKENPKLASVLVKVAAAIGAIMLVLGPLLIALPGLAIGIKAVGVAVKALTLSTAAWTLGIGLLVAAIAGTVLVLNKLKKAKEAAAEADERFQTQNKKLRDKLLEMVDAAGMTREEFIKLERAYDGNTAALAHAIQRGKEGKVLQEALAKVGGEHAEVIEEQKKAQEEAARAAAETNVVLKKQGTAIKELLLPWNTLEQGVLDAADAYVKGEITLMDYQAALREARGETARLADEFANIPMLEFEVELENLTFGVEGLAGVFKGLGITAPEDIGKVGKSLTETIDIMETRWGDVISGMGTVFGDFFLGIMDKNSTLTENFTAAWEGIKNVFKNVIADMAQEYLTNFLKKIVTSGITAFADVGKSVVDLGKKVTGAVTSIGGLASGLPTAIGTAVGTFLGGLVGKKTTGWQKAMQAIGNKTIEILQITLNYVKDTIIVALREIEKSGWLHSDILKGIEKTGWNTNDKLSAIVHKNDDMIKLLKGLASTLKAISDYSKITAIRLKSLAGFKTGVTSFIPRKETLVTVHPREEVNVTPFNKRPSGGGGGNTYNAHFHFSGQLDPNSARRLVREQIGPQFIEYVRTNEGRANSKLNQALGR